METSSSDPILSDRIQAIVSTEKSIDEMMKCAREIIQDLGKEKQIGKNKMEDNANSFKKLITQVENELNAQMQYLSHVCVGSSHQGSTFGVLQNSLLAQTGLSSLHSQLFQILTNIDPQPDKVLHEDEGESSENVDMLDEAPEDVAPLTISSTVTSSTSEGGGGAIPEDDTASSSAPRSQEDRMRRLTEEDYEDQMEQ